MSSVAPRPSGTTHVVGVIGWPVTHSLSPAIHNAAFAALGMDWIYVPMPVPPGRVDAAVRGLPALGVAGANVTMPHKTEIAGLLEDLSEDAARLGAVNTLVVGPEGIAGHNTDAPGFDRFLREDAGFDPAGRTALVFGAGGVARACALALARSGLGRLTVALREPSRAAGLRAALEGYSVEVEVVPFEEARGVAANLIVNGTPLGGKGEPMPLPELEPGMLVVDLRYRPPVTPLVELARSAGAAAHGGLGMLLQQAALSFELWTGQVPAIDVMSAAALAEVAETGAAPP